MGRARRCNDEDDEDDEDDDVYVWWDKVKSGQRQQPVPHLGDVFAREGAVGDGAEVHRALVREDLDGVTAELTKLRNVRCHDRPVSI